MENPPDLSEWWMLLGSIGDSVGWVNGPIGQTSVNRNGVSMNCDRLASGSA
jgi:hypothetical protein